jgi:hypothetical protein
MRLADVDGDGRLDALASQDTDPAPPDGSGLAWGAWLQRENGFVTTPGLAPPVAHAAFYYDYIDSGVQYADVNGDGLDDLVKTKMDAATQQLENSLGGEGVWLSTGYGWVPDLSYLPPVRFLRDAGTFAVANQVYLVDLNGDQLVDVLRAEIGQRRAWLQSPGSAGRWLEDVRYKPPQEISLDGNRLDDGPFAPYRTKGVLIGDVDANGSLDFVRAYENVSLNQNSFLSRGTFPDVLAQVTTARAAPSPTATPPSSSSAPPRSRPPPPRTPPRRARRWGAWPRSGPRGHRSRSLPRPPRRASRAAPTRAATPTPTPAGTRHFACRSGCASSKSTATTARTSGASTTNAMAWPAACASATSGSVSSTSSTEGRSPGSA